MKSKYMTVPAALVLGVAGIASAQAGDKSQQATNQNVSQSANVPACCQRMQHSMGNMHSSYGMTPMQGDNSPQAQKGDPSAPQNHVEYGG